MGADVEDGRDRRDEESCMSTSTSSEVGQAGVETCSTIADLLTCISKKEDMNK